MSEGPKKNLAGRSQPITICQVLFGRQNDDFATTTSMFLRSLVTTAAYYNLKPPYREGKKTQTCGGCAVKRRDKTASPQSSAQTVTLTRVQSSQRNDLCRERKMDDAGYYVERLHSVSGYNQDSQLVRIRGNII